MPSRLHGLDHLRALAITIVFLFHYFILSGRQPDWLPEVAEFGWTGVDLFFVLSGFLIASQLFAQVRQGRKIAFPVFFTKRFFRIVPAYGFTLALYYCVPFFREKESLPPLWKFLTFTQNLGLNLKTSGTFSHAWSLCVEEHFYLLLPLTLWWLLRADRFRQSGWLLVALFLLGFAVRLYSYDQRYLPKADGENAWVYWYEYIYYPTYNRLDGLLAGVSLASLYQLRPSLWNGLSGYGNLLLCVGLLVLTGAYFLCAEQTSFAASVFGFPVVAIGYGCLVAGAVSPASTLYRRKSVVTYWIATLSYAIYLTHKGVIHMTHTLLAGFDLNPNLLLLICMATCIGFAFLVHLAIEKPFLRLRDLWFSEKEKQSKGSDLPPAEPPATIR